MATFEDLLKDNHDEDLFEYYFTSQLATIDSATGRKSDATLRPSSPPTWSDTAD